MIEEDVRKLKAEMAQLRFELNTLKQLRRDETHPPHYRSNEKYIPARHGQPWGDVEEKLLLRRFYREGWTLQELARTHQRRVDGVAYRLDKLAREEGILQHLTLRS